MWVRRAAAAALAIVLSATAGPAGAGREPVLKQVDLPHSYYWRELYLPQLTSGPSSVSFTPDGRTLVYSMSGSLWRQAIGSDEAVELTHPRGAYDYQPDVAPDGRSVVFCRYDGAAIELWRLDLANGREEQLTSRGAVNVEPRYSPDGRRIAFVSTRDTGHFNLFVGDIGAGGITNVRYAVPPHRSDIGRYYYSPFDMALNPSWSPDGTRLFYVGNAGTGWGTGDIWSVSVTNPSDRRKVLSEETSWSARPELSPDGHRLLFASYHGRQWRQLWLTTPSGVPPLPMTFGDYDISGARWSPDGNRIAYVSNEGGGTALWLMEVVGGKRTRVEAKTRRYKVAQAHLMLDIRDEHGHAVPTRVSVLGSDSRAAAPEGAWLHADDGFDRAREMAETHYFHCASPCALDVPAGPVQVWVQHGFRYLSWQQTVTLAPNENRTVRVDLEQHDLPASFGNFVSADLHVHMNYGGTYRNTPANLARQARAEDLNAVYNLIVNKEERIPDIGYFRPGPDPASGDGVLILHSQEHHTSHWGHLGLLNLSDHYLMPEFTSYRGTPFTSTYPHNGIIADLTHAQGALVGYVHPFDPGIAAFPAEGEANMLPADMAAHKVDYIEVVGFSDHRATAAVWYRLLNLGFHLPAGAGTDAMANYASLHGPVGLDRVFLDTGGKLTQAALADALKAGRSFASNGPLVGLEVDGAHPGDTVKRGGPGTVHFRVALRSFVPVDHLELVYNGRVVQNLPLLGDRRTADAEGDVRVNAGGWMMLRAWNDAADPLVLDIYPYATTSPIYVEMPAGAPAASEDAAYFAAWMERMVKEAEERNDYNTARERDDTVAYLQNAMEYYRSRAR